MGILYETIKRPNLFFYEAEFNEDGSEKHISCDGARFHVVIWNSADGRQCSEKNCEINKTHNKILALKTK